MIKKPLPLTKGFTPVSPFFYIYIYEPGLHHLVANCDELVKGLLN